MMRLKTKIRGEGEGFAVLTPVSLKSIIMSSYGDYFVRTDFDWIQHTGNGGGPASLAGGAAGSLSLIEDLLRFLDRRVASRLRKQSESYFTKVTRA